MWRQQFARGDKSSRSRQRSVAAVCRLAQPLRVGMQTEAEDHASDLVRSADDIARRALALFGAVGLALGAPRKDIVGWLKKEGLWNELSPLELAYVSAEHPTKKQEIYTSWKSEGLIVLLWALGKVENLPAPNEQCDTSLFQQHLPPFVDISASDFISTAKRRSDEALLEMADELLKLHWRARDARRNSRAMPPELNIEIIQERHHAINWIIGYDGLPWDEVTTDT